ncbi:MAG: DUF2171 domain-containing protein [Caldilineaceae bacterium]
MVNIADIQEHMEVRGADGQHVGTVDEIEDNRIKLTKSDLLANHQHHYITLDDVDRVENQIVWLQQTAQQLLTAWFA